MVMDTLQSKLEGVRKTLDYKVAKVQSDFAYGLSSFMADKGVSKKELAERIGKTEEYIDNLLSGDVNFTIEEAVKVLDVLGARLSLSIQPQNECKVSLESIRRSVASSTAIETGESVEEIEKRLRKGILYQNTRIDRKI